MKSKKSFTLIELLIVVAIIAILAAILLPAMGKARERARNTVCINNMKQLNMGIAKYSSVFRDSLMSAYNGRYTWYKFFIISGYLNKKSGEKANLMTFKCPSDKTQVAKNNTEGYCSYSYNGWIGPHLPDGSRNTYTDARKAWLNISQINVRTAETTLLTEKWSCFTPNSESNLFENENMKLVYNDKTSLSIGKNGAHGKMATNLFADGHVEQRDYTLLYQGYSAIWNAPLGTALTKTTSNN